MNISIFDRFHNLSLKYKLLLSYLLLITLSSGLFLLVNAYTTARETEKQALCSAQSLLSQTKSYLDFKTEAICNSLNYIALNDTVKEIITRRPASYTPNLGLWNIDAGKLTRVILSYKSDTDIANIHLYMKQGPALIFQNEDILDLNRVFTAEWYQKLLAGPYFIRWYPSNYFPGEENQNYLYALRNISSEQNLFESIGMIKADVPVTVFQTILNQARFTKSTSALLINQQREIICTSTKSGFRNVRTLNRILKRFANADLEASVWTTLKLDRHKLLIGAQNIQKTDWILLIIVPYRDILALSIKSSQRMFLIFILITLATFPLVFLVAASGTNRLHRLTQQIRHVETGDLAVALPVENYDEIGRLTHHFNYMLTRIAALLEEKYQLGQAIKSLELKALQAQINPHFLYNTLDLINWMAIRAKTPEISRVVAALAQFYRLSLNKGEDTVTIQNELDHIKAYVTIQNMRFENCIQLQINVPEELLSHPMIKLLLQPLVENAIIHGILEKDSEKGVIEIRGERNAELIRLEVIDDGVGMSTQQAEQMLTGVASNDYHGYGVKNIHERIQLTYGADYGLSFHSEPGCGTRVSLTLPVKQ